MVEVMKWSQIKVVFCPYCQCKNIREIESAEEKKIYFCEKCGFTGNVFPIFG